MAMARSASALPWRRALTTACNREAKFLSPRPQRELRPSRGCACPSFGNVASGARTPLPAAPARPNSANWRPLFRGPGWE
jgi:hypothetical protein